MLLHQLSPCRVQHGLIVSQQSLPGPASVPIEFVHVPVRGGLTALMKKETIGEMERVMSE